MMVTDEIVAGLSSTCIMENSTEIKVKVSSPSPPATNISNGLQGDVSSRNGSATSDREIHSKSAPSVRGDRGVSPTPRYVSPAGREGRDRSVSSSSLSKSDHSDVSPRLNNQDAPSSARSTRNLNVHFRKVSINDNAKRESASSPSSGEKVNYHRASLIQVSNEKKARKVKFFINGDKFFKGAVIAVNNEKFRNFDKLLEHLTRIMCNQVTLPNGVRHIFSLDGKPLTELDSLLNGESYVCSSYSTFKKLDYASLGEEDHTWNRVKRETYYLGMRNGSLRRDAFRSSGHSKSFGQTKTPGVEQEKVNIKPRIITVLRSGTRPRKALRVLLNSRNTKSLDMVLADLTNIVKLDSGAVRKIFTLSGTPVSSLVDLQDEEVFIAYGVDKASPDDFDLDLIEFRNVQAILKSPKLNLKYEKFSHMSPKSSRKKFLDSRNNVVGAKPKRGSSKVRTNGLKNGSSFHTMDDLSESYPSEVSDKYHIRHIVGDGNFAVVRLCYSRITRKEYAVKIIDKAKCQGKEHMIESEISILSAIAHPNIIQLHEVFDFSSEKYLVMEYVQGGDLFDAIAADIKYNETVARDMVKDLANALQYLHDRMVCHRDIKPENLLVINKQDSKSLKLADFGLAVAVREPLFTVCGTPTYVAPEILAETGYGVKVDVWAIGVIMYILLCGYPPFSSRTNNQEELFDQILSGLFEFNSPDWDSISYPAKELVSWSLVVDPLQRYSAKEILQHPWIIATHLPQDLVLST